MCAVLAAAGFSQSSTSTRPRVAPPATPPVIANAPDRGQQQSSPPVLTGGRNRPLATPTPPAANDDDDGIIKVETNLVTMPVSVLDRDGRFIAGLQQRDFKIFENGVEQKVDYFQSVEQPFTVILMLDVSPSTQFRIDEIQDAAITFVNQLRPGDRVGVIAFDERVHVLSPITGNRNILRNAIRQAEFGDGTSLYEAVDNVIYQQLRGIEGRKAAVLFTDGVDTTSRRAGYDDTLRATEELDALFYTIRYDTSGDLGGGGWGGGYPSGGRRRGGVTIGDILGGILGGGNVYGGRGGGGMGGSREDYERGKLYLEGLAQNSGGREFEAQSMYNVDSAFSGIAEELRRQYSLGYYPDKVGQIGDRRQIKIRVMRPGVVVRAKTSYIVGQTNRTIAGK
jgi:VWFA-related protein